MARVTIEDCLEVCPNRFELIGLASKRAKQIVNFSIEPKVDWDNDKVTVVALREIAEGHTEFEMPTDLLSFEETDGVEGL